MKDEDDIYDEENVEQQLDNDEISPEEAGFMEGYDSPNMIRCKKCKKKIEALDLDKCYEEIVDGVTQWTCEECCD
jgi:hypothetical protein